MTFHEDVALLTSLASHFLPLFPSSPCSGHTGFCSVSKTGQVVLPVEFFALAITSAEKLFAQISVYIAISWFAQPWNS